MKNKTCLYVTLATIVFLTSCAKVVVVQVPSAPGPTPIKAEGVFYALPQTVLRIQLNVDHSESTNGTFFTYAKVFAPEIGRAHV